MTLVYSVPVTLGERLVKARARKELSQDDMAKLLGLKQPTISLWETDRKRPAISRWRRVAKAYGIRWTYFVPDLGEAA